MEPLGYWRNGHALVHACKNFSWCPSYERVALDLIENPETDINYRQGDFNYQSAIYWCCSSNLIQGVRKLFERKDFRFDDHQGNGTSFHLACSLGHTEIVALFLGRTEFSAKLLNDTYSEKHTSPYYAALDGKHLPVMKLLNKDERINFGTLCRGRSVLFEAVLDCESTDILKFLLSPESRAPFDLTPFKYQDALLLLAVSGYGREKQIRAITECGFDLNEKHGPKGITALIHCCQDYHRHSAELLLHNEKIDITIQDEDGCDAFYYACMSKEYGSDRLVEDFLIYRKPDEFKILNKTLKHIRDPMKKSIVRKYLKDPVFYPYEIKRSRDFGIHFFVLGLLHVDGYLKLIEKENKKDKLQRFLKIFGKLPLEMQMGLCTKIDRQNKEFYDSKSVTEMLKFVLRG